MSDVAEVALRLATTADAAGIAHVHRESWRTTYTGMLPMDFIAAQAGRRTAEQWQSRLSTGPARDSTFIAFRNDQIVGFASCGAARHRMQGLESEIYALYVLQDYQRHGVGRDLVRACAAHFVRQGEFGFYLWVLKANRARMFYEALGGQEMGEKTERLGQHSFAEIAYGWHDLTGLVGTG
ncbi:MAG: GNAT family N-acetyltransferase [Usitatibacter sp.]